MAIEDALPDRPLTLDEFQELQHSDNWDAVYQDDQPGRARTLFLQKDGEETILHYTDEHGWHEHEHADEGHHDHDGE